MHACKANGVSMKVMVMQHQCGFCLYDMSQPCNAHMAESAA